MARFAAKRALLGRWARVGAWLQVEADNARTELSRTVTSRAAKDSLKSVMTTRILNWMCKLAHQHKISVPTLSMRPPIPMGSYAPLSAIGSRGNKGKVHLIPQLSWVRSLDHFQLTRNSEKGENFHRTDVFTAGLNAWTDWVLGRTAAGAEVREDVIYSTNLGNPSAEEQWLPIAGKRNGTTNDMPTARTGRTFWNITSSGAVSLYHSA